MQVLRWLAQNWESILGMVVTLGIVGVMLYCPYADYKSTND
jgi:hypothetical protein